MKWLMFSILFVSLFSFFASAEVDCSAFDYSSTNELLSSMDEINSKLSMCNVMIPEDFNFALKNKNIFVSIDMNSGETEEFYISIVEGKISSLNTDILERYSYYIFLSETTMNEILQSDNMLDTFLTNLDNGNIIIDPRGMIATMTWFFANLFF